MFKKIIGLNVFRYIYFFFCLFSIFPLTASFCSHFSKFFLIWGYFLVFNNLYKKIKSREICTLNMILFVFYLIVFLSALINKSNVFANINLLLYCVIQTYLMSNGEFDEKYISKYSIIFLLISIVHCFVSLLIFFTNYQNTFTLNNAISPFGVYEGRLFGAFSNPNVGSFISWLAIVFCFNKLIDFPRISRKNKIVYILITILNFIVLSLGNSRSVMIMFFLTVVIYSFIISLKNHVNKFKIVLMSIVIGFISVFSSFYSNEILANLRNTMKQEIMVPNPEVSIQIEENVQSTLPIDENSVIDNTNNEDPTMERDFSNQEVSNGRFDIWKCGIKVSLSSMKNFFFGVGNNNILAECLKENINATSVYSNMHNIYLQIFVGSGFFAILAFLCYFFKLFNNFYQKVIYAKKIYYYKHSLFWISIILIYLISGLFDSNLIYFMNVFMTVSFWTIISFYKNTLNVEEFNEKNSISD